MLVTSGTYAYLEMKKNTSVAGSAKCNGINYQGQEINASNLSSTTNYLEGAKSMITLSQSEDCKIYSYVNIYLHVNDNITAPIDSIKALKYKLITEDKIEYNGTITTKGDSLLAVVPLTSNPKSYQVYLWIDSEISNGQFDNKSFSGYIYATSEQSSTIDGGEISNNENVSIETIDFDYVGREQEFMTPVSGKYKLETWGAQGGSGVNKNTETGGNTYYIRDGGYGAYSIGYVNLNEFEKLYLNIGGGGDTFIDTNMDYSTVIPRGYNGGGSGIYYANGGGATDISIISGTLSSLENSKNKILIVAGGGGGTSAHVPGGGYCLGGAGGGFQGNSGAIGSQSYPGKAGIGGTQQLGYKFGQGEDGVSDSPTDGKSGGGGGYYGGSMGSGETSWTNCAGGGSGYIGNSLLTNKSMYCYECVESSDVSTKTISTTNVSDDAISGYAKKGNGYARITLIK